jgi:hypothetical protein
VPEATVRRYNGKWAVDCTCGWGRVGFDDSPEGRSDATRAGARHLFNGHGIYAGGHKPTMAAMGDANDGGDDAAK